MEVSLPIPLIGAGLAVAIIAAFVFYNIVRSLNDPWPLAPPKLFVIRTTGGDVFFSATDFFVGEAGQLVMREMTHPGSMAAPPIYCVIQVYAAGEWQTVTERGQK